jgi:hypothetical protein
MGRHTWIAGLVLCIGLTDRQTATSAVVVACARRARASSDVAQCGKALHGQPASVQGPLRLPALTQGGVL